MTLLQLVQGSKQYGPKVLFDSVTFSLNEGEHVGVVGPNGAGKTTLFKILVGRETLDSGEIVKSNGLRIGYLEQESDWTHLDLTPETYFTERQGHCWPIWEVKQWGKYLGLNEHLFQTPFRQFSGGYRMRFKLLDLISQDPHLMLLDEPTNFLDLETLLVLERFLCDFKGAFLLISHDREFLKQVADHTLEIEGGDITKFPGNIDDYFEAKEQLRSNLEKQQANLEQKRKHLQTFIDRFGAKATKASQAQSRIKQLEKMNVIDIKPLPVRAQIAIPGPTSTGKEILSLAGAQIGYQPNGPILRNVELQIRRGNHFGIVGFNGAGKSTLLKSLAGSIPLLGGSLNYGYEVAVSYFAQHSTDQLRPEESILEALSRMSHPFITQQDVLNLAGALLFSGNDVHKKIRVLSGGEKSRVALGQVLLQKSSLLLLDEPTNHLDFETVEALTQALALFEGSIVVVSHDRSFIRRIADKILEIRDGKVQFYPGSYDEYIWSLEKGVLAELNLTEVARSKLSPKDRGTALVFEPKRTNSYEDRKRIESERKKLEKEVHRLEHLMSTLTTKQAELNDQILQTSSHDSVSVLKVTEELSQVSSDLIKAEDRYLEVIDRLEYLKT